MRLLSPPQHGVNNGGDREGWQEGMSSGYKRREPLKPWSLSRPGSADTDRDTAILSLSVETTASAPGQRHVGVVSTNLQWALKHWVAEPVVERRKAVLGEDRDRLFKRESSEWRHPRFQTSTDIFEQMSLNNNVEE